MYFQIENTPERIRKARRQMPKPKESSSEEIPRLILGPFVRPPQVVFEDVPIGSCCEKNLEMFNPTKQLQQITLGKELPPGLVIGLPEEWLELEPETCYYLTMMWTPIQPTAMRETIRFTDKNRGRYDVIVVLKSVLNTKGRNNQPKGFKTSPGKKKKKTSKKSPVAIYKKKSEVIYNTSVKVKKTVNVVHSTQRQVYQTFNKEDTSRDDYSFDSYKKKCPFDSPSSMDLNFNTSEVFYNVERADVLQETYDKSYNITKNRLGLTENILRPSNKQNFINNVTDFCDNLTFSPLKSLPTKIDKLDKGPRIILSVNSESDCDDSLEMTTSNKENQTHSIISITSLQPPNKWIARNQIHDENQFMETPTIQHKTQATTESKFMETPIIHNKKQPNTSSPTEFNSPNFSINTDVSRISDLSFFPQRFSTERKLFPKINETQEMLDDKLSSDTFTKSSPNNLMEPNNYHMNMERPPHYFCKDQPKVCRQSLFREYQMQKEICDKNYLHSFDRNVWQNDLRVDSKSPPRSITPPLQSIPEESAQFSDTHAFDNTQKHLATFTIDRTFDRPHESSLSTSTKQTWSKKAIRVEPDLWKVPVVHVKKHSKPKVAAAVPKDSMGPKISNVTFESNKSINQNITANQIGNIYSQSSTVDPFLSATYFYDEEAVHKFENEFKRWLNCILTPPADLDSNVEQKIDVGKAWLENRNKEVPLAPTKEQVSSTYHNSQRLESLRRSARNLLVSPEMTQVFQKLNVQIERKLIAIRNDRNLHLDIGLQKTIMEVILSYNPLWLRIGLEAIYGIVLPLKSNSDVDGLTTFIVQRMFKNPFLKNKQSKSSAPNILLPAYMEAIKKFTLKKFFMLVFFLDQAKQKKLISHDPCLFCRNAICKESREILIRFTKELIAGIGDITRHLRPLGYVVCHKQSYLDEYKYAVYNLALDIRDGVRLTKVMEIIMMKNGLLHQLRTPAISRLQKIHNVQVAMNALKEASFVINGDITATDIADGHREKTLSLLWQIIHVFRAPLFEKAANIIQTWWRKKYDIIVEKRKEEERIRNRLTNAASVIQHWWRKIQYNRQVEWRMQQITRATIVVQKYCRMWLCKTRLRRFKASVLKIEGWFRSVQLLRQAKFTLKTLILERERLRYKCAIVIQSHVRGWLCRKHYKSAIQRIVKIQSLFRMHVTRRQYIQLRQSVSFIQDKYRSKLLMKIEMQILAQQRRAAIVIQNYYRMITQRRVFLNIKKSVQILEERYIATMKMRNERIQYLKLKKAVITIQALYRSKRCRLEYRRQRNCIIQLQRKIRAYQLMKKDKIEYLKIKSAAVVLQIHVKSYLTMKKLRHTYIAQRNSAITIQKYFRSYLKTKSQREAYLRKRQAAVVLQKHYRSLLLMRRDRKAYLKIRESALCIQRQFRAQIEMRKCKESYTKLQTAVLRIQHRYRALIKMREQKSSFMSLKHSCIKIQNVFRANILGKQHRQNYLKQKEAVIIIQNWFRNHRKGNKIKQEFEVTKQACVTVQRYFKAYIIGRKVRQEYIRIKSATICVQRFYRSYLIMKTTRQEFIQIKTSTIKIQKYYRSHLETKQQRERYLKMKSAVSCIENIYKRYKQFQKTRQSYLQLRETTIHAQRIYRRKIAMRVQRNSYLTLKQSVLTIQQRYRAFVLMRAERESYLKLRSAVVTIQTRYRAYYLMKQERLKYLLVQKASISIQRSYKAYILGTTTRQAFLTMKKSAILIQRRYKALLAMKRDRSSYLTRKAAAICIQRRLRAQILMFNNRQQYKKILKACQTIQRAYRAYVAGKRQRISYLRMKTSAIFIQTRFRMLIKTRNVRHQYQQLRNTVIFIQRRFRSNQLALTIRKNEAAKKIQTWYRSVRQRDICREEFLLSRRHVITVQSLVRMYLVRKRFIEIRRATLTIQRYYRTYRLTTQQRQQYIHVRQLIIAMQSYARRSIARKRYLRLQAAVSTIQTAYKLKRHRELLRTQRETAVIVLQKYIRRYLVQSWYKRYRQTVLYVQEIWRGKLLTRLIRCTFLQKRSIVIKIQSLARGYLIRKQVQLKREYILKTREAQRRNWAASKIQALFRGHKARMQTHDVRVVMLRRRWREGALQSTQESLKERNEAAIEVLRNMCGIETVISAFQSLELLTEVSPMMYDHNASSIVRRIFVYMSVVNRSISSIDVLKSGAAILVNLARYRVTGPKIYARERIVPILKFMWRFSSSETLLFCKLATYLWLCSKYDGVREDLKEFLHTPENHKMLVTIKGNVCRMKRMANNARNKFHTPQPCKFVSHFNNTMNNSACSSSSNTSVVMPALEPDYGIVRIDKPRYFEDPQQAINCLFHTYNL